MQKATKFLPFVLLLIGFSLLAISCGGGAAETIEVTVPVEVTKIVEVPAEYTGPDIPFLEEWQGSGHNDTEAEAFIHWDEDDPAVVSADCARCHTTSGYQDYLGVDGTEFGLVDTDHPIGQTVACVACHNDVTVEMTSVVMPSGLELTGLGDESRCMVCHQGRESKVSVDERITAAGVEDDTPSEDLRFANIHYYAAAATKYGTLAKGGYEYDGKSYDARFAHVSEYTTCIDCHDSHTLEVKVEACSECHEDVTAVEDLHDVRMAGSAVDYDGDGDTEEGIYDEIIGLQEMLAQAMAAYTGDVLGSPIVYSAASYPYFFTDLDGDGMASEEEAIRDNAFASWSPRILRAAYNYQVSLKDPGAFAHGGKYIIQLLYDSIEDLNAGVSLDTAHRIDAGHFAGSEEAFRHWDDDGYVSGRCSRCHTSVGLPLYLDQGVTIEQPISNGFTCETCHNDLVEFTRHEAGPVTFPSGKRVDSEDPNTNLCMNCHQGRESGKSVDEDIAGMELDTVPELEDDKLGFINIHYFAAGATRYGSEAAGGYQYEGQEYVGQFMHEPKVRQCYDCHDVHSLEVQYVVCADCHEDIDVYDDIFTIREEETPDYDGDGDVSEGMAGEIDTLYNLLYQAILTYSVEVAESPIVYSDSYPYWVIDTNANGVEDPDESGSSNRYEDWTPRLLQAAYNYQYVHKDPGAFAHNGRYILQLLYDSLMSLSTQVDVDLTGMIRP